MGADTVCTLYSFCVVFSRGPLILGDIEEGAESHCVDRTPKFNSEQLSRYPLTFEGYVTGTYLCTYVCLYACTHVRMHVCMYPSLLFTFWARKRSKWGNLTLLEMCPCKGNLHATLRKLNQRGPRPAKCPWHTAPKPENPKP